MFGFSKDSAGKMDELVKKKKWDKLKKFVTGSKEEQLALAKACKLSTSDDSVNLLIQLLSAAASEEVLIAALQSLGEVGTDHAVSQVQLLLDRTPNDKQPLYDTILDTLRKLRGKK